MYTEENFKKFISRWLNGINNELKTWEKIISQDNKWKQFINSRTIQSNIEQSNNAKKILDVCSGPVTVLEPSINNIIYACDALAVYYNFFINKYNRKNIVDIDFCFSERLYEKYDMNYFDQVHAENALDHCFFPMISIFNMLYVVKIGGEIILKHYRNEAEIENYHGFHQFNIDVKNGKAVLWNKETNIIIDNEINDIAEIYSNIEPIKAIDKPLNNRRKEVEDFVIIKIIKKKDFDILKYIKYNNYFDKYLFLVSSVFSYNPDMKIYEGLLYSELNNIIKLYKQNNTSNSGQIDIYNNIENRINNIENKLNKLINELAWWIPVKKWRDNFRNKMLK